jgi:hypothetical protein
VGTTIFTIMSRLAQECGAINLSQGFPDFSAEDVLFERVAHWMRAGHNQYAPMAGVPALRAAIAAKVEALYGAAYDPEHEVTVTAGATQALFTAVAALVHPGDEVIVFEPVYDLCAGDRAAGRRGAPGPPVGAGLPARLAGGAGAGDAAHADDHDQHAPQPHRHRVDRRRPGRAGGDHPRYRHRGGGRRGV